jgi:hypothetical protein
MKNLKMNIIIVGTIAMALAACSFVSLTPQAENVTVSPKASTLSSCKFLGNTNVSIWSKADTFQSQKSAESQLDILARNQAATMNGNTVAPTTEINNGQREYGVYNCPTN